MSQFPKNQVTTKGKNVNEATELALKELGAQRDDVEVTVIEEGAKGIFGIGAKDAEVTVKIKDIYPFAAKRFLSAIFDAMSLDATVSAEMSGADEVSVNLEGENMGIIIGKRGDTLDSLQYLTSLVVNQLSEDYIKVSLDTENYREKRTIALETLAARLAKKVKKSGKKYTLEPMTPYERRIIHATLQNDEELVTYSVGEEPYRKLVIALKNPKGGNRAKRPPAQPQPQRKKTVAKRPAPPKTAQPKTDPNYKAPTYKSDFPRNQRPESKDYKNFDEYLESHTEISSHLDDVPEQDQD